MEQRTFNKEHLTKNKEQVKDSGQVVLILVLITIVGLTVGLSLISRTITDIRISYQIEESSRAFSAAEAAVETALRGSTVGETRDLKDIPGAEASYKVEQLGGTTSVYTFSMTEASKVQTVWLAEHDGEVLDETTVYPVAEPIDICWGSEEGNSAALVMTLLYKDADDQYKVAKMAYDPEPLADGHIDNNFKTSVEKGDLGTYCNSFLFRKTINTSEFWEGFTLNADAKLLALRLQPVYGSTAIGVKPQTESQTPLPSQGKQIISVGKTEGGVVRRIQVAQEYQTLPEIFNFTFFSEN